MGSIPWFLFLLLHCLWIGMQPISVHQFCILKLCWIHESILAVFWWNILGFTYRVSCHLWRVQASWLIWMLFISLCCLIAESKTSNAMLNNSGESGHPCLVPNLSGKALSFFPIEDDISVGSFIYGFYDLEVWSFYPYFLEGFYQERMLYFVKCYLCIYWEDHMFLSFLLLMWWITLIVLQMLNQPCIPGINPTWSWWIIFLNVLLDPVG